MNNGQASSCGTFTWVTNSATAYIQLTWPTAVTIGSFYIETENSAGTSPCSENSGRNLSSGTVQVWNGMSWVNVGGFSGQVGTSVQFNMPSQVSTTQLRLYGITASPGNGNIIIFQWHVYSGMNCAPPP
jgi:hypothetical protein